MTGPNAQQPRQLTLSKLNLLSEVVSPLTRSAIVSVILAFYPFHLQAIQGLKVYEHSTGISEPDLFDVDGKTAAFLKAFFKFSFAVNLVVALG
jgi:hypothetical protein